MSSKHQKGEEQILPYKGSLQNKKNSKKSDIVTIRSGTYLPYLNSDIKIKGSFQKNNDETYGKFHISGGGQQGSFSICYHKRF